MKESSMKGIFLGAGASYECGMPLVWEFTNVLRANILKRLDTHLFDFRENPSFKAYFQQLLSNPDLHYEEMIGKLETIQLERGSLSEVARTTALQLVDCVQILLLEDQEITTRLFAEKVKDYSGISSLLTKHPCLSVFSLNHDINFEEICKFHNIDCRDGFFDEQIERYSNIAIFKSLRKEQIDAKTLNFFESTEKGVNLIKLHGSLDIFAVEDKNIYLKCAPPLNAPLGGHVQEIRKIEQHSIKLSQAVGTRTIGELDVTDNEGEIQFLRRSLLSGANKFKGTFDQVAPIAFFEEFKRRLTKTTELDVIGYGFGDNHVNEVLEGWIKKENTKLNIYDPHRETLPERLTFAAEKIKIINFGLTGYFRQFEPSEEDQLTQLGNEAFIKVRENLRKKRLGSWPPA